MRRFAAPLIAMLLLGFGLLPPRLHAQQVPASPEAAVTSFYQWFFKNDNDNTYPLRQKDIYNYDSAKAVDSVQNEWGPQGPAHSAMKLGDVAVVAVTFGAKDQTNVLVFLRKQDGRWKITKVDDTWDYE